MNFFEQQAKARRNSTRLVVLFALAVIGMVLAIDLAVLLVAGANWPLLAVVTLGTLAVIGLGSLYRLATLRGGGDAVALQFGGTPVPQDTGDASLRRLRNVVEEIAIASGVPVPGLYVMEGESAINAFAAGYSPSDAAIAVTRGALDRLNRDELQGVIAHEFSHVANGDMRLNIRLMGVLFGILMISLIGRKVLYLGGSRDRNAAAVMMAALVALVVGSIGMFFGRMIKASVSRSRERLADASAVQFTRQTTGLAGALKKIAGLPDGARLSDRADAEEASHMLFGDGVGFSGLFATHPPILERIQALEPGFRGEQLEGLRRQWSLTPPSGLQEDRMMGLDVHAGRLPAHDARLDVTPPMVAAQVGHPEVDDYQRADAIVHGMPASLRSLAQSREAVVPLVLGLLLDDDAALRGRQLPEITARLGDEVARGAKALHGGDLQALHPMQRLPLAALAFPVLRRRPRPELETLLDTVHAVVHCDGKVSLFEYCLGRLLEVQLRESLDPRRHARFGRRKPGSVREEFATLLAVVAHAGNPGDPAAAQRAYLAGLQRVLPRDHLPYAPPTNGVLALDEVWPALDALEPLAKQLMVEAVTAAASHDGRISVAEAELLRTICGVLHCPLPPDVARIGTAG
ncbi:M48 family metallopeptidase [Luteimonas sp. MC1750]|uniref:M48 family metallopeptidase n=1 Tax=Luteimonas sp. MC1750 TaxID=2799326 RepID=UPI0018F086CD|nr:M48 family metallopeptidase [Luteimonas sp. MC1750]MBJ6983531.1 M48 family metallopeptidase [Luteimonas sp. MC1750]QQO06378.1 M48 family metallopeptidase [Luteimonas sp. MC1750]